MSFTKVINIPGKRAKLIECKCDQCGKIFVKRYNKNFLNPIKLTFCSNKCRAISLKKGGLINQKYEKTCLKKFGSISPSQSIQIKEKIRQTCLRKYGVENTFQSEKFKEKIRETLIKHYGVDHPMHSKDVKNKIKKTCLRRYGVDHQWKSNKIRNKAKLVCLKKYGVEYSTQSQEIKNKIKKTCLKLYGVENPYQSEKIKIKKRLSYLKHYGVDHPLKSDIVKSKINFIEISKKSHQTMKRNGSYCKSKIEDQFYVFLCEKYGEDNVERQTEINNWNIDFYVKSLDLYIQLDGVYWHGLDRPIEVIKEFKNTRDEVIYNTYLRDQEQNEWFKDNNLNLVRITDKQFKDDLKNCSLI